MKKIFAIALALVMVLSMASAFALNDCFGNFNWTCPTKVKYCGRGTVEVVPYVKLNNGCGGYDWQINTCATAINTERIYFAIKLNVEANPDSAANHVQAAWWWDQASLKIKVTGADAGAIFNDYNKRFLDTTTGTNHLYTGVDWSAKKAAEYYFNFNTQTWDEVEDATEDVATLDNFVKEAVVTKATKAKVCAELVSEHSGLGEWHYGDYTVNVAPNRITFAKDGKTVVISMQDGKVNSITGTDATVAEVFSTFGLTGCGFGTCINADNIKANFGWDTDGALKKCFSWSDKGVAITNPECKVEIPKTGDVSVVAYAVMALVAAAGAMGLKK